MIIRTGVDLLEIDRLNSISPNIKARFLRRVYTSQELALARDSVDFLAGRFAAKEAVSKALGTGIGWVSWQDIEILQAPTGEPILVLHGRAYQRSQQLGLETWSVSISDTRTHAVAMAVAFGDGRGSVKNEGPFSQ